jgi:Arc/MetJ-type ribon-helix-helix transcriptional regulator
VTTKLVAELVSQYGFELGVHDKGHCAGDGRLGHCVLRLAILDAMAQLVTRVDERLLADVDALVSEGVAATRSEAVRLGLEALVEHHRRAQIGQAIVDGYRRHPQDEEELAGLDEATRALIEEEQW